VLGIVGVTASGAQAREAGAPEEVGREGAAVGTEEVRQAPEDGSGRIAVNRADAEMLMRLPGIGPKKARALIEARERRPFRRPSDLRRVKGFGPKTILRLAPRLSFE